MTLTIVVLQMICAAAEEPLRPLGPEVAALYNLVGNSGFEAGEALPEFWKPFPPQPEQWGRHQRDTEVFRGGQASGLLISTARHPPGKAGVQWNRYGLAVEGGRTLIVSYWTRTEGVEPAGVGFHFYDAEGGHLGAQRVRVPPGSFKAGQWIYVRGQVQVPEGAVTMGCALYSGDEGRTWYDDVAVLGHPRAKAMRGTPTLDGRLGDECWAESNRITSFAVHTGEKLPTTQPEAWIAYDDQCLYVAFRCPHPPGAELLLKATEHDGEVWLDDSVEVFLDPHHGQENYFQLCVNSQGVIRDSHRNDTGWESGAQAAVVRGERAWTVELSIPLENLDLGLSVGPVWGLNLVRNDRADGETSTWSLGGFHRPGRFGAVHLAPDLTPFVREALSGRVKALETRRQSLQAEIQEMGIPAEAAARSLKLLGEVQQSLAKLRRITTAAGPGPRDGWEVVLSQLTAVDESLTDAWNIAVEALFFVSGPGEDGAFRLVIVNSLQKVRRSGPLPPGKMARKVDLSAARDETESFQLVIIPVGGNLRSVTIGAGPLSGPGGNLPITWHRVEYVETGPVSYPNEYVGWWPDPLVPAGAIDVKAEERQPLWFSVNVPPEAEPGLYTGQVTVRHGELSLRVPVELKVRKFRIPRPGTLATPFGLYARFSEWWSAGPYQENMPIEMFREWCEFMGRYRLSTKNIGREYVTQTKTDEGLRVDMTNLRETVLPLAPRYFAPYSFCFYRLPVGNFIGKTDTATDPDRAAAVVKTCADEWKRQGLPPEVYLYGYDEPRREHYPFLRKSYREIKEAVPDFPIMQTIGDSNPQELVGAVDIWCPLSSRVLDPFYQERRKAGDTLWMYVCCGPKPPHANFFVDEPATDHRVLFWQAWQAGATGFLYWYIAGWDGLPNPASGQECFPDVPIHLTDLKFTYQQLKTNGDGLLVYPGRDRKPWPSLRLEVIRDGIEDYEYLSSLSRLVKRARALPARRRPSEELLQRAEELCLVPKTISRSMTRYTKDPHEILARREQVGDMIDQLFSHVGE